MLLSYLLDCIYPLLLLLLFSSRCATAGISGESLAAEGDAMDVRAKTQTKKTSEREREREKKWESLRACVSLACVQGGHNAETEMKLLAGHQVSENKDVCASNAGNWGSLGSARVFPSTFALDARHSSFQAC